MAKGRNPSGAYTVHMGGIRGNPPGRERARGNIEERSGGSLRVRVYAGVDVLTGRDLYLRETIPAGPDAGDQAELVRDQLVRQVEEGRQPRTNATVGQLVDEHLKQVDIGKRTKESLQGYARKHIHALKVGASTIGEVGAQLLETFYAELRRCRDHCDGRSQVAHYTADPHRCTRRCRRHTCKGLADATILKIHFLISAAYETAIRWEWISTNPTTKAKKPSPPPPDPQPPTAEQAAALVNECCRWGDLGIYVWLAMITGARRGELCALRWGHLQAIHAARGHHDCIAADCRWILTVRRAIAQAIDDGEIWEKDTKTHQRRHIALDAETVAILLEHRQRCEKAAAKLGITLTDEHFMFAATPEGIAARKPDSLSSRFKRCATRLGITTCLKNLRHYSATELITGGVDIRTVAGRLGHGGGGTTTLRVYAAWVAAADQLASTVLLTRMPERPLAMVTGPAAWTPGETVPRKFHEQLAATLYTAWRNNELTAGTEVTVKGLAQSHSVTEYTAHQAITHLKESGVLEVRNGHRSVVLSCPDSDRTPECDPQGEAGATSAACAANAPSAPQTSEKSATGVVLLDLVHLGTSIRKMTARADPSDFDALETLLRAAVRRAGGDITHIADYELAVHIPGQAEPVTTVVVAA